MFPKDSPLFEPYKSSEAVAAADEVELVPLSSLHDREDDVSEQRLRDAVLHDLNELIEELQAKDWLDEEALGDLTIKVEDIRDSLYSTFS